MYSKYKKLKPLLIRKPRLKQTEYFKIHANNLITNRMLHQKNCCNNDINTSKLKPLLEYHLYKHKIHIHCNLSNISPNRILQQQNRCITDKQMHTSRSTNSRRSMWRCRTKNQKKQNKQTNKQTNIQTNTTVTSFMSDVTTILMHHSKH